MQFEPGVSTETSLGGHPAIHMGQVKPSVCGQTGHTDGRIPPQFSFSSSKEKVASKDCHLPYEKQTQIILRPVNNWAVMSTFRGALRAVNWFELTKVQARRPARFSACVVLQVCLVGSKRPHLRSSALKQRWVGGSGRDCGWVLTEGLSSTCRDCAPVTQYHDAHEARSTGVDRAPQDRRQVVMLYPGRWKRRLPCLAS